jgi:hypothetical protein
MGNIISTVVNSRRPVLYFALAVCLLAGCTSFKPDKFDQQVRQWVPLGTSVAEARRTMEHHGFDCEVVRKDNPFNQDGYDSLECDKTEVMFHTWSAKIIISDDKVSGYGPTSVE